MDPAPGFDPRLPHDLVHFAVEREHGIGLGVFGQLAAGGNLRTFRRLDAKPDKRLRRRGERLARWSALGIGGSLTVHWHEIAGSLHPANEPGRRSAHRPRRGVPNRL